MLPYGDRENRQRERLAESWRLKSLRSLFGARNLTASLAIVEQRLRESRFEKKTTQFSFFPECSFVLKVALESCSTYESSSMSQTRLIT